MILSDCGVIGDFEFLLWVYLDFLNFLQQTRIIPVARKKPDKYIYIYLKKKQGREVMEETCGQAARSF